MLHGGRGRGGGGHHREADRFEEDVEPRPDERAGFGSKSYSRGSTVLLATVAIGAVLLVAALTTYLVSVIGGDREATPVNQDSIQGSATETTPRPLPRVQPATASVPAVTDGSPDTVWTGQGGVTVSLADPAELHTLLFESGGGEVEVYGLTEGTVADSPEGLPLLGSGELRAGRTTLELDRPMTAGGVLLWFPASTVLAEVEVVGLR